MKIRTIELDDEGMPEGIVAHMTTAEAAFLARILGKMNFIESEKYQVSDTWGELAEFFNRFYDGGVHDFSTPPPMLVPMRPAN